METNNVRPEIQRIAQHILDNPELWELCPLYGNPQKLELRIKRNRLDENQEGLGIGIKFTKDRSAIEDLYITNGNNLEEFITTHITLTTPEKKLLKESVRQHRNQLRAKEKEEKERKEKEALSKLLSLPTFRFRN